MSIIVSNYPELDKVSRGYDSLVMERLLATTIDYNDMATFEGDRYEVEFDATVVSGVNGFQYIMYQMPPLSSGVIVGLSNRTFKTLNGECDLKILWDTTGTTLGAALPIFNDNRNSIKTPQMQVNLITGTPTTDGIIREGDFVTGTGTGANSSGSISPSLGLRLYSPDSFFVAKLTNLHNASNRIKITYSWIEIPISDLKL
jgi:hypothetical protein